MKRFLILGITLSLSSSTFTSNTIAISIPIDNVLLGLTQKRNINLGPLIVHVKPRVFLQHNKVQFNFIDPEKFEIAQLVVNNNPQELDDTWLWLTNELPLIIDSILNNKQLSSENTSWITNEGKIYLVLTLIQHIIDKKHFETESNALSLLYVSFHNSHFGSFKNVICSGTKGMLSHSMYFNHNPLLGTQHHNVNFVAEHISQNNLTLQALLDLQNKELIHWMFLGKGTFFTTLNLLDSIEMLYWIVAGFSAVQILEIPQIISEGIIDSDITREEKIEILYLLISNLKMIMPNIQEIIFPYKNLLTNQLSEEVATLKNELQILLNNTIEIHIGSVQLQMRVHQQQ